MAKVAFSKLSLKKTEEIDVIEWNEQKIEVKQYLLIEDKLDMIANIINQSADYNGYYNPARIYIFTILEIIDYYTNISLTEKQKADVFKTFDLFVNSGLSAAIFDKINPYEYNQIKSWVHELINSIYVYKNSAMGLLDSIKEDYNLMDLDISEINEKLVNKENLALLKDVLEKLG